MMEIAIRTDRSARASVLDAMKQHELCTGLGWMNYC
jgi:hypothetical protein